jgi:hypothetical protein
MNTATGFDFEPLPDGNVLIAFFGDDGTTINKQIVTPHLIRRMPVVAVTKGPEVALEIVGKLNILKTKKEIHNEGNN